MALPAIYAAITIATTVMQLFGPKGYSISNLLAIQTDMLRNISQQLSVIQKGIETILEELDDIQKLLKQLPERVSSELYHRKLQGLIGTYRELMEGFISERDKNGILKAREIFNSRFEEELIKPLREVRNTLYTFNDPLHIPMLTLALHAEVHSMILNDTPQSVFLSALKRYETFLSDMLSEKNDSSITQRLITHRAQFHELILESSKIKLITSVLKERNRMKSL